MMGRALLLAALAALALTGCVAPGGSVSDGAIERSVGHNREAAKVNTELAAGYLQEGQLKVAVEKARRAIAFDDGYGPAHHVHALLMSRLGEEEKARESFARAVRLDADNSDLANNYGGFLCSQGDYEQAQAMFRRAYSDPLYETPEYALVNSGRCYQEAGQEAEALAQFRRALDKGARQPAALLGVARALYETGEPQEAAEAMRRYESRHRHTPGSLAVAIAIDKELGDQQALKNHRLILRGRFPDSPEAQAIEQGGSR
ncbi:type IV pilus biogenesis/stability protein PilW [Guyparkeria hydrothermalis]|uniref:type IV pilus biogenesis/stability protein PilW n=1 Tax=Guyparkeria hydrothermalis TaxID=923 RepID=UPI002020FD60|nr:type IV pilus biogenesis/stability protein PilW [Guyparkeria hydrothermalis]MCL7745046.1 type IV pilus biogenesis/stability protein PilW [Guyparkeria hydrothermalis]